MTDWTKVAAAVLLVVGTVAMVLCTIFPLSHPFALWVGFTWGVNTMVNACTLRGVWARLR